MACYKHKTFCCETDCKQMQTKTIREAKPISGWLLDSMKGINGYLMKVGLPFSNHGRPQGEETGNWMLLP